MRIVKQMYEILYMGEFPQLWIANTARTCYKPENKDSELPSARSLTTHLASHGHMSMIEFAPDIIVKFITNRGVTHELVRHRLCSFAQESTRYVNYEDGVQFIQPVWWDKWSDVEKDIWTKSMEGAERAYQDLINLGCSPQQARDVLPNALKTEIVVKANLREWLHIFKLRCSSAAHPQIHALLSPLKDEVRNWCPEVFVNE